MNIARATINIPMIDTALNLGVAAVAPDDPVRSVAPKSVSVTGPYARQRRRAACHCVGIDRQLRVLVLNEPDTSPRRPLQENRSDMQVISDECPSPNQDGMIMGHNGSSQPILTNIRMGGMVVTGPGIDRVTTRMTTNVAVATL